MRKILKVVASVLCLATMSGGMASTPAAATPNLSFSDCGDGLQCGELSVPVNWDRPGGARSTLALAKLPALDAARKSGVLLVNLGGPQAQISAFRLPVFQGMVAELRQWFDVVIFDPRGFEASGG